MIVCSHHEEDFKMKLTYSAKTISKILRSEHFKGYREMVEDDADVAFTFVSETKIPDFLRFVRNLLLLERESRLDYITEIQIDFEEMVFMDENIYSTEIDAMDK